MYGERAHEDLSQIHINIFVSRSPFFKAMYEDVFLLYYECYPKLSLFQSVYQLLFRALKGGLNANTEQYISICPSISVFF